MRNLLSPLHQHHSQKKDPEPLKLEKELLTVLSNRRPPLLSVPALLIPDYNKLFTLYSHELSRVASGDLTQLLGPTQNLVHYCSAPLNSVASRGPPCLTGVAVMALVVTKCADPVLGCPLTIMCSHKVIGHYKDSRHRHLLIRG